MYLEPWLADSIRVTLWFLRAVPALHGKLFHLFLQEVISRLSSESIVDPQKPKMRRPRVSMPEKSMLRAFFIYGGAVHINVQQRRRVPAEPSAFTQSEER